MSGAGFFKGRFPSDNLCITIRRIPPPASDDRTDKNGDACKKMPTNIHDHNLHIDQSHTAKYEYPTQLECKCQCKYLCICINQHFDCLFYYFYFIDKDFGLCYLRVPTWDPFRLRCFNLFNEDDNSQMTDDRRQRYLNSELGMRNVELNKVKCLILIPSAFCPGPYAMPRTPCAMRSAATFEL